MREHERQWPPYARDGITNPHPTEQPGDPSAHTYTPFRHGEVISAQKLNEVVRPYPPAIRRVVWWMSTIALGLGIILMIEAIAVSIMLFAAANRVADTLNPGSSTVGCPFGEQDCGG